MSISKPAQVPGIAAQDIPASCGLEDIAHDFNNLLSIISMNLNIMRVLQQQGRADDLSRYVTTALTATQQAAALMLQLPTDSGSHKASSNGE